jgi:hypothetical protein
MALIFCCEQSKQNKIEVSMLLSLSRKEGTKAHHTQAPPAAQDGTKVLLRAEQN